MPTATPSSVRWLAGGAGAAWRAFEITSRGDRVRARLHLRPGASPEPLALVVTDDSAGVPPCEGIAVATLDLPLLGTRRSPKWSERLEACLRHGPSRAADRALVDGFLAQGEADLRAVLDVCADLPEIDADRMGVVGVGPGAAVAARLRGTEPRVRALWLCADGLCAELAPAAPTAAEPDPLAAIRRLRTALTRSDS